MACSYCVRKRVPSSHVARGQVGPHAPTSSSLAGRKRLGKALVWVDTRLRGPIFSAQPNATSSHCHRWSAGGVGKDRRRKLIGLMALESCDSRDWSVGIAGIPEKRGCYPWSVFLQRHLGSLRQ